MHKINLKSANKLAIVLISALRDLQIKKFQIDLLGDLGAGKTQFTKFLVSALGITEQVTSPTYSLLQRYSKDNWQVLHLDLYRTNGLQLQDLQAEVHEYFNDQVCSLVLVEWANLAQDDFLQPDLVLRISQDNQTVQTQATQLREYQLDTHSACAEKVLAYLQKYPLN